jgi:hypothetical protein
MPEAHAAHAQRGSAHSAAIRALAAYVGNPGNARWVRFIESTRSACLIPQLVETGREVGGFGYVNPGTAACLEAIAIMNMEFSGQPYNAERE